VRFAHPGQSAQAVFEAVAPTRTLAELGLLAPGEHRRPVGQLSLGQQRRLALAVLVAIGPDLVLLDEPSNHLSLTLVEELEEALRGTRATVVVATHDRWLRRRWSGTRAEVVPR
jgi:macrolide transport system ATP-binding/permease protein